MPEIKHNFTKGKMNKDLDERIIPNGEYRDAMNIQVSTSEGAEVGTVQNILGNSEVLSQSFITENAVCVGSVADEKNDKFYWFIHDFGIGNLISSAAGGFSGAGSEWTNAANAWDLTSSTAVGLSTNGIIATDVPGIKKDRAYRITYDIPLGGEATGGKVYLKNHSEDERTLNSLTGEDHVYLIAPATHDANKNNPQVHDGGEFGTYHIDWVQSSDTVHEGELRLWNDANFDGAIDNITIMERNRDIIAEYNVNTNEIKLVFVDMSGEILNFNPNKIITSINVIDGMLLWCDGIDDDNLGTKGTEPKKINIQRSIAGTHPGGYKHTNLINPAQGHDMSTNTRVKEEHITVVKKPPKHPLTLQYQAFRDPEKNYTGVMNVTDHFSNPNLSILNSSKGYVNDFSFLDVGDTFKTTIETDITGDPNVDLAWNNWSPVVIREFDNDDPPSIPISNYTIKGKITDWDGNSFQNIVPQLVENTDFDDNSNWTFSSSYWNYDSVNKNAEYYDHDIGATGHEKLYVNSSTGLNADIKDGETYAIRWTVGEDSTGAHDGEVFWRLVDENDKFKAGPLIDTPGNYYVVKTMDGAGNTHASQYGNNWANSFYFESSGFPHFRGSIDNVSITHISAPSMAKVEIRIDSIDGIPSTTSSGELKYAIDKLNTEEKIFEFKFPRFSYRYKYEDGEYSAFAPFTEIAFIPGMFNYHPKKGHNLGMTNNLKSVTIKDFTRLLPADVKSIDILYKEEHSPNIYIVDTIKDLDKTEYEITSETLIGGVVPSNQLLRSWDNVPRKALTQDIVGNRIVYGNYLQNYNLKNKSNGEEYVLKLDSTLTKPKTNNSRVGKKSIKSLREYQVGVVYSDEYGRETPVLTNEEQTIKVEKDLAGKVNKIQANILNSSHPLNMKSFKFYIKDTSSEYYNLAMDRWYNAEDDNIWLAFPSTDRNKVDVDDFLILKKGVGKVTKEKDLIKETARYKILDIKNEAPDFIKRKETLIASKLHMNTVKTLFKTTDLPVENDINFTIDYSEIQNSSYANLHEDFSKDRDVEYHISLSNTDTNRTSNRYKIAQLAVANSEADWKFTLENAFTNEINSFTNDETGYNSTHILDNTYLNIYKTAVDKSASYKFDGRFFVKIYNDDVFRRALKENVDVDLNKEYKAISSRKIYSLETYSGNRIKKHYVNDTNETFKGIESNTTTSGLNDKVSNNKDHVKHNWFYYNRTTERFGEFLGTLNGFKENRNKVVTSVNTRDKDVWRDYDAYFRGINTYIGDDATQLYRVNELDLHDTNVDDQKFEDVWFIDEAVSAGHFFHSTTSSGANTGWDTVPYTWFKNSLGITGNTLELAFGGIQPIEWSNNPNGDGFDNDPSFYDLAGENIKYSDSEGDFINNIAIGSQFRFKEDPSHEVYTITNYEMFLRVRYESLLNYCNDATEFVIDHEEDEDTPNKNQLQPEHLFPFHSKAVHGKPSGWDTSNATNPNSVDANNVSGNYNQTGKGLNTVLKKKGSGNSNTSTLIWGTCSYLRPSNYTYNWRLILDKSLSGRWNPAQSAADKLVNSKSVTLKSRRNNTTNNNKNSIFVNSLGDFDNRVEAGMVFDKYDGSVITASQRAVISKIEDHKDGTWTLWFKTYDGTDNLPSGSTGDIDQVGDNKNCRFRQWPMNGLSPNSAKNLNFFRGGKGFNDSSAGSFKSGTDAVGYTLEWVEEKESRSQEEVLPKNPAVWETKPKEGTDLDIYYEASGRIPIEVELTTENILDFLPIGSKVEHEGSSAIPPGTKIKNVNIDTQEITLTKKVEVEYDPTTISWLAGRNRQI